MLPGETRKRLLKPWNDIQPQGQHDLANHADEHGYEAGQGDRPGSARRWQANMR